MSNDKLHFTRSWSHGALVSSIEVFFSSEIEAKWNVKSGLSNRSKVQLSNKVWVSFNILMTQKSFPNPDSFHIEKKHEKLLKPLLVQMTCEGASKMLSRKRCKLDFWVKHVKKAAASSKASPRHSHKFFRLNAEEKCCKLCSLHCRHFHFKWFAESSMALEFNSIQRRLNRRAD